MAKHLRLLVRHLVELILFGSYVLTQLQMRETISMNGSKKDQDPTVRKPIFGTVGSPRISSANYGGAHPLKSSGRTSVGD
jgi:hypothetical protein